MVHGSSRYISIPLFPFKKIARVVMWLLKTSPDPLDSLRVELVEFSGEHVPPYAILSHTWGAGEVLFNDVRNGEKYFSKPGFSKVMQCLEQAARDGFSYAWIDSLCINKDSSAELSEAINSMYEWYRRAGICYAYMSDVATSPEDADFGNARWWSRGWCLQELLAPRDVVFYSSSWTKLGTKISLKTRISEITKIDSDYLDGSTAVLDASVARRMSWAASRQTTRAEDLAYCLMGLFAVNMPMLYGEGRTRAFHRLQEEIMKYSDDASLFAWFDPHYPEDDRPHGLLADSPSVFAQTAEIVPWRISTDNTPWSMTNRGIHIGFHLISDGPDTVMAALDCRADRPKLEMICMQLKKEHTGPSQYVRVQCRQLFSFSRLGPYQKVYVRQYIQSHVIVKNSSTLRFAHLNEFTYGPRSAHPAYIYKILSSRSLPLDDYEAMRREEVERHWPSSVPSVAHQFPTTTSLATCFKVDSEKLLSAVIFLRREVDYQDVQFALLVGLMAPHSELGFGALIMDSSRKRSARMGSFEEAFDPKPEGTSMEIPGHIVRVHVKTEQSEAITVHLLQVDIEVKAKPPGKLVAFLRSQASESDQT